MSRLGHNKTIGAIAHRLCQLIWIILHKGDCKAIVFRTTAQIGGIHDCRVNHQLAAAVVAAQLESDLIVGFQDEARLDGLTNAAPLLVSHRLAEHYVACGG